MGYSVDLRQRVVDFVLEGQHTYKRAAEVFNIGISSVNRYLRAHRRTGSVAPKPHGGGREMSIKDGAQLARFRAIVDNKPDATLNEIASSYNKGARIMITKSTAARALKRLNYTRKKKHTLPPNRKANEFKIFELNIRVS